MIRSSALVLLLASFAGAQTPCLDGFGQSNNFLAGTTMGGPNLTVAIQLQNGASPLLVDAIEVFSGGRSGASSLSLYSHDPVNNVPGTSLGGARFSLSSVVDWQGVTLPTPVPLTANQTFWLVWEPVNGCQISAEQRNRAGEPYRGSFDGGRSWNGPFQNYDWKYRLWCGGYVPGGAEVFGQGCPGSGRGSPRIGATAIPRIGGSLDVTLAGAVANGTAIVALGASDSLWGGAIRLPYRMDPIGAPGCVVWIDLLATASQTTSAVGEATFPLTVANDPALVGVQVYAQWLVRDAVNSLGLVTSDALELTVGS